MKLADFKLSRESFRPFGQELTRPECVWIDDDGVWVSDERGGVALISSDGKPQLLGTGIKEPNGYSRQADGQFVVAGLADGAVHRILADGTTERLLDSMHGKPLGAVNCAFADEKGRIWVSVMTRNYPWYAALSQSDDDGYILRIDQNGARCEIVAEGLALPNEVKVSPDGKFLYAAESAARRIVRFPLGADGSLGQKEVVGPENLGHGACPDGFAFDPWGNIWVTVVTHNGLSVIDRKGDLHIVYSDANEAAVEIVAEGQAIRAGRPEHLMACGSVDGPLRLPTSLAFGGDGGRTVYVGSLLLNELMTFEIPEALD